MPPVKPARPRPPAVPAGPPEVVDPRWILKAAGAVLGLGLLCSYLTLCGYFYLGQWQLVLHPSRAVPRTPSSVGLEFSPVRFGDDKSGQPQLSGWWIPGSGPSQPTVLMLHGETGSMSDALPEAKALHDAQLNVLLFDYRGYGQSGGKHPTESLMESDATSALEYLTGTRGISPSEIVVYGSGLGASLATRLCQEHPALPGMVLQSADGDTETRVLHDQRTSIVPLSFIFRQRFPLADPLSSLRTPKLLISYTTGSAPLEAQRAGDPKMTVELAPGSPPDAVTPIVRRFLDTYLRHAPPSLDLPAAH